MVRQSLGGSEQREYSNDLLNVLDLDSTLRPGSIWTVTVSFYDFAFTHGFEIKQPRCDRSVDFQLYFNWFLNKYGIWYFGVTAIASRVPPDTPRADCIPQIL